MFKKLTDQEMQEHVVGEAFSLAAIMAVLATAVVAVVVYKIFLSGKGGVSIPGGWKFNWD